MKQANNDFFEILLRIAQEISAMAPDKIGDGEALEILQRHLNPFYTDEIDTTPKRIRS